MDMAYILGLILSIPTCFIVLFLIFKRKKKKPAEETLDETIDSQEQIFFFGAS